MRSLLLRGLYALLGCSLFALSIGFWFSPLVGTVVLLLCVLGWLGFHLYHLGLLLDWLNAYKHGGLILLGVSLGLVVLLQVLVSGSYSSALAW